MGVFRFWKWNDSGLYFRVRMKSFCFFFKSERSYFLLGLCNQTCVKDENACGMVAKVHGSGESVGVNHLCPHPPPMKAVERSCISFKTKSHMENRAVLILS
jgi:hypothetical protein